MSNDAIRQEIVAFSKQMLGEGLVSATSGNISIRIPGTPDAFAITPSSENYLTMTPDRIVIMKVDGTILECPENGKPSSEWRLHAAMYKKESSCNAVVHTHSPYASAFATVRKPIPYAAVVMGPVLGGEIPVADFGPLGSWELADNSAAALGDKGAVLMANHGVMAVGPNLTIAYVRATYVEDAAKIILLSKSLGEPVVL